MIDRLVVTALAIFVLPVLLFFVWVAILLRVLRYDNNS